MILSRTNEIKIFQHRKNEHMTRPRDIKKIRITKSMIPENIFIDMFETQKINPSGNLMDNAVNVTQYNIQLNNFFITSENETIIDLLFDIFLGDFENKTIQELAPEINL